MSQKPFALLMAGVLAVGALAFVAAPIEARPRGGGHGGHGGFGGGRGGFSGGRGGFGGHHGGFGSGRGNFGFRRGGFGFYGLGYGLGYGGYYPYYGSGYSYSGYTPYYDSGYANSGYTPYYDVDASASVPSTEDVPPVPNDAQAPNDNMARMLLIVPDNAEVWFQDQKTDRTGREREFISPELTPGKTYTYKIRVRYTKADGQVVDETRNINVKAKDKWSIDFTKPEPKKQ